ncbi:hypothetical protein INR49_006014 [Caranx melampygus]|nr:hypothetical protein INR49_006014 [Caranx melampygus]
MEKKKKKKTVTVFTWTALDSSKGAADMSRRIPMGTNSAAGYVYRVWIRTFYCAPPFEPNVIQMTGVSKANIQRLDKRTVGEGQSVLLAGPVGVTKLGQARGGVPTLPHSVVCLEEFLPPPVDAFGKTSDGGAQTKMTLNMRRVEHTWE